MNTRRMLAGWRRVLCTLAVTGGCLFVSPSGCLNTWQHELEVLIAPEANSLLFGETWLGTHSFGQKLIKWWNWGG